MLGYYENALYTITLVRNSIKSLNFNIFNLQDKGVVCACG